MLKGSGLSTFGEDAIGVIAFNNDEPLLYQNTTVANRLFDIEVLDDTKAIARGREGAPHSGASYLGGIVSADRQTVYWVNETKPLP